MSAGRVIVGLCFAAFLALGGAIHRDYGVSADEDVQRETGAVTVRYVLDRFAPSLMRPTIGRLFRSSEYGALPVPLEAYGDNDYGVAFEAPAVALELLLGLTDPRDIFLFRHLLTFLASFCGACAIYRLARRRFADWRVGLLAVAFLLLSPRLFAESFYNSKDAVFMAAFAIALEAAIAFVLRPSAGKAVLHGLATAFAIDVRVAAIVLPAATLAILAVRLIKRELAWPHALGAAMAYLAATAAFVVALWPWLWSDPLGHFAQALVSMSRFRFDYQLLYLGRFVRASELPWHYIPVWMSITTPPLYGVLFVVGTAATVRQLVGAGWGLWKDERGLQDLALLGLFVAPVMAVIVLQSVLYDGWRQLYFAYPAFLMVAVRGWCGLWEGAAALRHARAGLGAVTAVCLAATAAWMWRVHPLQNVYFNALAGSSLKARFELDYWGLATRGALEHVLARDPRASIDVGETNYLALGVNASILAPKDRSRVRVTEEENMPHYLFSNAFTYLADRRNVARRELYALFHEVTVDGEVVLSVFKRRDPDRVRP